MLPNTIEQIDKILDDEILFAAYGETLYYLLH